MFKKIFVAGLALGAGWFILSATHLGSYAKTAIKHAKTAAKRQVPLEFQIETLKNELANLDPDMKTHISKLAEETVSVQRLRDQVADASSRLESHKGKIRAMGDDLKKSDVTHTSINSRKLSAERLRDRLELALSEGKRVEDEIKSKSALLDAKERALEAAREQLAGMRSQKEQLEIAIAQMEAELKTVRLAQSQSKFQLDDSRLSDIKGRLSEIQNQLQVERTKDSLAIEFGYADSVKAEKKSMTKEQLLKEVESYLGAAPDVVKK